MLLHLTAHVTAHVTVQVTITLLNFIKYLYMLPHVTAVFYKKYVYILFIKNSSSMW